MTSKTINPKYNNSLSRIFSRTVLMELISDGRSNYLNYILNQSDYVKRFKSSIGLSELFDDVYSYLCNNYRSEYVYKNAIANKILLGRHSINTSTLLNEFRVGNSKADIVIINGDSSVYEVKSEYDSMERLQNQIKSYRTVFDYINIVTHFSQLDKIIKTVDKDIGIIVLTDQYLSYLSPKSSKSYLSQVIFNLSRTEIDTKLW